MPHSVLVTGLGLCTPLGSGVSINWENLIDSSVRPGLKNQPGVSLDLVQRKKLSGFLRARELGEMAAAEALSDAGIWDGQRIVGPRPETIGCTVSASKPLFDDTQIHPPDALHDAVRSRFGLLGESRNVVAACATGAYAIATAASWIEQGLCEVAVAGSVEPYPVPLIESGFRRMGVLSPDGLTRPFDRNRSGFGIGEGAGVVVLESSEHAKDRGRTGYAHLSGWGLGADAHSPVAINSNGERLAAVLERALVSSGLSKSDVRHVNAHGTATPLNDRIETQALIKAFGPHADRLMISATKGRTGHLLGAAGSVEFIFTVLALRHQYIPPTTHLEDPDPACPLDYTAEHGHPARFEHALSLSLGFGGSIGVLAVSPC